MTADEEGKLVPLVAADVAGVKQGEWTHDDYAALPDNGRRYEIMDGILVALPSNPSEHQNIAALFIYYLVQTVTLPGLGKVLPAPLDVEFTPQRVLQPDLIVVLNEHLSYIKTEKVVGPPDLIIEISTLGTSLYDRVIKYRAYEEAGVAEYWVVYLYDKSIEVLALEQERYQSLGSFKGSETIPSRVIPGLTHVAVEKFFSEEV